MSLKIDRVQLEIIIKNDESRRQMGELETDIRKMKTELAKMQKQGKEGTDEYIQKLNELKQKQSVYDTLIDKIGITNLSMRELTQRQKELNAIMSRMDPNIKEYEQLKTQLDAVKGRMAELRGSTQQTQSAFANFSGSIGKVATSVIGVIAIITGAIAAVSGFVNKIVAVRSEFEKYEAVLTNSFGSESKGKKAINDLADWAAKTPNQLSEATEAYGKLIGNGFKPAMSEMTKFGDIAASKGKTIMQFIEAETDAEMLQFERLKEFGIKAQQEGDKVVFTFKGMRTSVGKDAESIRAYLLGLGDMQGVKGSMEAISKTLSGSISNLKDNVDAFFNAIGSKVSGFAQSVMNEVGSLFKGIADKLNETKLGNFDNLNRSVVDLTTNISPLLDRYDVLTSKTTRSKEEQTELDKIIAQISTTIPTAVSGFDAYGKAISISTSRAREFINTEKDRLKVVNKEAIDEVDKTLKNLEEKLAYQKLITDQIAKKGTFAVPTKITSLNGDVSYVYGTENRDKKIIDAEIQKNQKLLSEYNGYKAERERLNGDYLQKELDAQKKEADAAEEDRKKKEKELAIANANSTKATKLADDFAEHLAKLRGEALDGERQKATEELNIWKLKEQDSIKEAKYSAAQRGELTTQLEITYNKKKSDIDRKYTQEHENILLEFAAFVGKNNKDLADQRQASLDDELAKVNESYRQEENKLKESAQKKLISADEYFISLGILEQSRQAALDAVKLADEEKFQKAKLQVLEKYDQYNPSVLEAKLAESRKAFEKELELFKGNEELKAQLRASFETGQTQTKLSTVRGAVSSVSKSNTTGKDNSLSERLDALREEEAQKMSIVETFEQADLANYQDYENIKTEIARQANAERLKLIEDEIAVAMQLVNTFSAFFESQKQLETAKVDKENSTQTALLKKQKADELKIAGTDEEKKKAINEKYSALETKLSEDTEAQKNAIAKKYADKEFAVKVAQIVADTAVAIMKALAQLGPIAGGIAGAVIAGTGIVQLNIAKQQRDQVMGLETGGYMDVTRAQDGQNFSATYNPNKRGYVSSPTVLVGEYGKQEYVVSNEKLNTPPVQKMVDLIDSTPAYKLRTLDISSALNNYSIMRGYANGGYTTTTGGSSSTERFQTVPTQQQYYTDPQLLNAINTLNQILASGQITAQVGFFDFMNKYRQFVKLQDNITLK